MAKVTSKAALRQRRLTVNRGVRWAVQIVFFIAFPAVFSASFNGVKYLFTQLGARQPVELGAFLVLLCGMFAATVVLGRFFCGYACAFGTLGDVLFTLFTPVRKKIKPKGSLLDPRLQRGLQALKYVVLAAICLLCFTGAWSQVSGYSPWTAFAGITGGNVDGIAAGAFVVLGCIAVGMLFVERFFCQFLCPLGALFSLMPVLPFSAFRRDTQRCARSCNLCKRNCPVSVHPDPDAFAAGECIACGRCADGCPVENVTLLGTPKVRGTEIALVLVKAAALFALCWWLM